MLFLVFPVVSLLSPVSLIATTLFIFLIQIATVLEIRSGAVRWLRSGHITPALLVVDGGQFFKNAYSMFLTAMDYINPAVPLLVVGIFLCVDLSTDVGGY